jgi:glycosyltransferase involved in cell wall biosynthesis
MNSNIPLVSICCITYNHELYIQKSLEGFLIQKTKFSFEVLIHDDASQDKTAEIIRKYEKEFPEIIKPIYQKENRFSVEGGGMNIRYNFPRAKGKYIAMCEGDDYWTDPLKLQKQVDFLEANTDYKICFHPARLLNDSKGEFLEDYITRDVPTTTNVKDLALGNYMHTSTIMFRNRFVVPEWFFQSPLGDWTFYMIIIDDLKIHKLNEEMSVYRLHRSGIWSGKSQKEREYKTMGAVKLIHKNLEVVDDVKIVFENRLKEYKICKWLLMKKYILRLFGI